ANKGSVTLNWSTTTEKENSHFEVLRSTDGKQFNYLKRVNGNGTATTKSNYQYSDQNPFLGLNYYQLKQVDFNGVTQLSKPIVVAVKLSQNNFQVQAPAQSDIVNVFTKSINGAATIQIYDMAGEKIWLQKVKLASSNNKLTFPVLLVKGVYVASLFVEGQPVINHKFIKE
ncbi:T9SS type A sorting domain-containing protein, partial [Pedobacter sp.]